MAGRTDAGVHALGQVASIRCLGGPPIEKAAEALNTELPEDVAVIGAEQAPDRFHARFSARSRTYRYRVFTRRTASVFELRRSLWVPRPIDEERLATSRGTRGRRPRLPCVHAHHTQHRAFRRNVSQCRWEREGRHTVASHHGGQLPAAHGAVPRRHDARADARRRSRVSSTVGRETKPARRRRRGGSIAAGRLLTQAVRLLSRFRAA